MTACIQEIHNRSRASPRDAHALTSGHVWILKERYLLWFELHLRHAGGIHHRFGSPERVYEALPLRRQTHETALHRVEGRVHPVLEVPGSGDLQPPLPLLLPLEHPAGNKSLSHHNTTAEPCARSETTQQPSDCRLKKRRRQTSCQSDT